jgi:hypothetical protein
MRQAFAAAALLAATIAPAQQVTSTARRDTTGHSAGVQAETVSWQSARGRAEAPGIVVRPAQHVGDVRLLLSAEPLLLEKLATERGTLAIVGLGNDARVAIADRRLRAWPPADPTLVLWPEGTASLRDLGALAPAEILLGAARHPLRIGDGDGRRLLCGPLPADDVRRAIIPGEVVLRLSREGGAVDEALFRAEEPVAFLCAPWRSAEDIRAEEAALYLPAEEAAALAAVQVRVPIPEELRLAEALVPLARWVRRGGADLPADASLANRLFVARDPAAGTLRFLSVPYDGRSAGTIGTGEVLRQAFAPEFSEVAEFPTADGAVWIPGRTTAEGYARPSARLALLVTSEKPPLLLEDGRVFRRLAPKGFATGAETTPSHPLSAMADLRSEMAPDLRHFAAVRRADGSPITIRITLSGAPRIGAVDIIHAEAAGFSPELGLRAFRIEARAPAATTWTTVAEVANAHPLPRQRVIPRGGPVCDELRLVITEPNFLPSGDTARIAELILWGTP